MESLKPVTRHPTLVLGGMDLKDLYSNTLQIQAPHEYSYILIYLGIYIFPGLWYHTNPVPEHSFEEVWESANDFY